MAVVIIIGGGGVRNAVTAMEQASIGWTAAQRSQAEKILSDTTKKLSDFTQSPQPPA